jgi:tricorn protease
MILRALIAAGLVSMAGAEEITRMRGVSAPALSADGKSVVFEWIDDLWTVPADGGEAVRVVEQAGRDAYPRFTPDGKRIVFSSDRSGSMQVYSISTAGGETVRHTWHSEGNELECLSPDGTRAIVRGLRERAGFRATRLMEISLIEDTRERMLFDATATSAAWSPDGSRILFCRSGEQLYRKGYRGSRASQIWEYDLKTGSFSCRIAEQSESRFPIWNADGKGFHFVSGRSGVANVWLARDGAEPVAVTDFKDDGAQLRDVSADGATLLFHRGLELFRFRPGNDTAPVPLEPITRASLPDLSVERRDIRSTTDADFTEDASQIVFAAAGELWWIPAAGEAAARLTETAAAESGVRFSADGAWLYFLRDDGLSPAWWRARFSEGTLKEETIIRSNIKSKSRLKPSPDGSKLAWIEGTGDVITSAADGSSARCVYPCWNRPTFDWSPDGRWLAVAAEDRNANRDLWLVAADGGRPPVNLTRHPAFEGSPRWSPDGKTLVFSARRGADGKSVLWKMDFEKFVLTDQTTDAELRRIADKAEPISTGEIEPTRVVWAADSRELFFQSRRSSDKHLYALEMPAGSIRRVDGQRGVPVRTTADGALLWRVGGKPAVFRKEEQVVFPIRATVTRPRRDVLEIAFRRVWRTLGERFYDVEMGGTDWDRQRLKYEPAAAEARSSRQFDRVVSQLFGELNASHLSFLRKPWPEEVAVKKREETTAHPGLVFRNDTGKGPLVIQRVIRGAPVALRDDAPAVGESVVRIAGEAVDSQTPLHRFFQGAVNRALPVVVRSKQGRERVIELRPISYAQARLLDLKQRDRTASQRVKKAGKYAYLRVPDMNRSTFDQVELEIYRLPEETHGLVLDLRNNGGGREADRLLSLFCQPEHSFTRPRGGPEGYPQARRVHAAWTKPLVVLCNEHTFSNAEIFCHAMRVTKRAPLVGQSTAGGVISAVKETIPDAGELQVPFRGWFLKEGGKNLDLNGAEPDFRIAMTPSDEAVGKDPQLDKALEVLREKTGEGR